MLRLSVNSLGVFVNDKWMIAMTAGTWQLDGIKKAKALGFKVLGIDASEAAPGLTICDEFLVVDIFDKELLLDSIKKVNITPIGVVSYCSESGMMPAAWIREEFNLTGPDSKSTAKLLYKHEQRKIWQDRGVEELKWILTSSLDEAVSALSVIGLPLIVKPVDSSGSRGVSKVIIKEEFENAFNRAKQSSKSGMVLLEEFIEGVEYTVEAFTANSVTKILAVTEKAKVEGSRGTVALELAYPSVAPEVIERIKNKVLDAVKALDYQAGPSHTEVILTKTGRIGIVEMAGRGGGFGVFSMLVPLASGVDIGELLIRQVMGEDIDLDKSKVEQNIFSLKFFPSTKNGTISGISGFEEMNKISGVAAGSYVSIGQEVYSDFLDGNRLGYMLVKAETLNKVRELLREIERTVSFETS